MKNWSVLSCRQAMMPAIPSVALILLSVVGLCFVVVGFAQAQTESVLYSFNGGFPAGTLIMDSKGDLYGTTEAGGVGWGTVFELMPPAAQGDVWVERILYAFKGGPQDGATPLSGLVRDKQGNFYGTTEGGGANAGGTVFEVTSAGREKVLYSFANGASDGYYPYGGLVRDTEGNLYGTTRDGGVNGGGMVFEVTPSGVETVLYNFQGYPNDGWEPVATLIMDGESNLYGTTQSGGSFNWGTAFKLSPPVVQGENWSESVLHSFNGNSADGVTPVGSLIRDKKGNLYGTTQYGGAHGFGTIFELTSTGIETILYNFKGGATDGNFPRAGLLRDSKGNLYGTTGVVAGSGNDSTVFELTPAAHEKVLHVFQSTPDGYDPEAGLIMDGKGNLYGTTFEGGTSNGGTVFEVIP